jgi:spermidine synthase
MGFTLRAVLDALPGNARVVVAEVNPAVVGWCRGSLGTLTGRAITDPRVTVKLTDVAAVIDSTPVGLRFDAILLDLYQGPCASDHPRSHPLYGRRAVDAARAALNPGGVLAVWGEDHDPGFAKRLAAAGFAVQCQRPGRGGYRGCVYLGVVTIPKDGGIARSRRGRPQGEPPGRG